MANPASEKKPNQPVTILPPVDPEEFVDLEPDAELFGTDDVFGLDLPKEADESADR